MLFEFPLMLIRTRSFYFDLFKSLLTLVEGDGGKIGMRLKLHKEVRSILKLQVFKKI